MKLNKIVFYFLNCMPECSIEEKCQSVNLRELSVRYKTKFKKAG